MYLNYWILALNIFKFPDNSSNILKANNSKSKSTYIHLPTLCKFICIAKFWFFLKCSNTHGVLAILHVYLDLYGNKQNVAVDDMERPSILTSWKMSYLAWLSFAGNVYQVGWGSMTGHSQLALDLTCCPNRSRAAKRKKLVRSSKHHHIKYIY